MECSVADALGNAKESLTSGEKKKIANLTKIDALSHVFGFRITLPQQNTTPSPANTSKMENIDKFVKFFEKQLSANYELQTIHENMSVDPTIKNSNGIKFYKNILSLSSVIESKSGILELVNALSEHVNVPSNIFSMRKEKNIINTITDTDDEDEKETNNAPLISKVEPLARKVEKLKRILGNELDMNAIVDILEKQLFTKLEVAIIETDDFTIDEIKTLHASVESLRKLARRHSLNLEFELLRIISVSLMFIKLSCIYYLKKNLKFGC